MGARHRLGRLLAQARPRFRLRTLVILIAGIAVALGAGLWADRLMRRSAAYRQKAAFHAREAATWRRVARDNAARIAETLGRSGGRGSARELEAWTINAVLRDETAAYHDRLQGTYAAAAARPWSGVVAEPPKPDPRSGLPRVRRALIALSAETGILDLSLVGATDEDLKALPPAAELRAINLSGSAVTDDGLVYLAGLRGLESLRLAGTRISDAGLAHLEGLRTLKTLDVVIVWANNGKKGPLFVHGRPEHQKKETP